MERNRDPVLASANPGETSNNGKKRYKRVMTPARKAQNRAAQKAYRESQSQIRVSTRDAYRWLILSIGQRRKEFQEQQLNERKARKAFNKHPELRPHPAPVGLGSKSTVTENQPDSRDQSFALPVESLCAELGLSQDELMQIASHPHPASDTSQGIGDDFFSRNTSISVPLDIIDTIYMGKPDTLMLSLGVSAEFDHDIDIVQNTADPTTMQLTQNTDRNDLQYLASIDPENKLRPTDLEKLFPRNRKAIFQPDPWASNLEFPQVSLLRICLSNARCLGINIDDLFTWNCMSLCSPFYRPSTTTGDDPKALLAAVSSPSIPRNLQPTLPQILFPHHPILDLIPFPGLRACAITLAATSPPLLSPLELKKDIISGGLMCWGTRNNPGGQPWDMRSWEATPWFIKKWRLLLDGRDGELSRQSTWWRAMRGDTSEGWV